MRVTDLTPANSPIAVLELTRDDVKGLSQELGDRIADVIDPTSNPCLARLQGLLRDRLKRLNAEEYRGPG